MAAPQRAWGGHELHLPDWFTTAGLWGAGLESRGILADIFLRTLPSSLRSSQSIVGSRHPSAVVLRISCLDIWADAMTTEHVCPKCQSKAIDRAPRQDILERLIVILRRKRRYRCRDCDYRFYDRPVWKP